MNDAEQQVRAAIGHPDLWVKPDGSTQGYGFGPWWDAERIKPLVLERDFYKERCATHLRSMPDFPAIPQEHTHG